MTVPKSPMRMPLLAQVSFGVGGFGISLVYMSIGFLLFYFYTEVYGLTPAQAGAVIAMASFWDALADPLMGWIASRTRTRFGRYRPFLLFGSIPMSLAFVLMFWNPGVQTDQLFVLALATHILFRSLYQAVYMPYTSLVAQLSHDADERSDIEAWRAAFISVGTLTVTFAGLPLVSYFGGGEDARGFLWTAVVFGALSSLSLLFTGLATREIDSRRIEDVGHPWPVLKLLVRNQAFLAVLGGSVSFGASYAVMTKVAIDLFHYDLGDRNGARWALAALSLAGILISPVWAMISRRIGKRTTWMSGAIVASAALMLAYLLRPQSIAPLTLLYALAGVGIQAIQITLFAALADAVDFGEWRTGQRVEAMSFGVMTFANKISLGVGAAVVGTLLTLFGFVPGQAQIQQTLDGLRMTALLVPAIGLALSAVAVAFFPISTLRHRQLQAELHARRRPPVPAARSLESA